MIVAAVFIVFVALVGLVSWRLDGRGPRNCCSLHAWPPDDLSDEHTASRR